MNIKKKKLVHHDNLPSDLTILKTPQREYLNLEDESQLKYPQPADELDHELDEALRNKYKEELDQLGCPRHPPELQCIEGSGMCAIHIQVFGKCFDKEEHTKYKEEHEKYLKCKRELENLLHIMKP